ncbi:hypothetical protein HDU67_004703 [Dinochytrium kinnereticum]|nr:hypothetical protein HDU67_004703 [Dinochytrium kinnereticum]
MLYGEDEDVDILNIDDEEEECVLKPIVQKTKSLSRQNSPRKRGKQAAVEPVKLSVYERAKEVLQQGELHHDSYNRDMCDPEGVPLIDDVSESRPLERIEVEMKSNGPISGMKLSPCGGLLAAFSTTGQILLFNVDTLELICTLKDDEEQNIDEFYCGQFVAGQPILIAGGKSKDRTQWSLDEDDSKIITCPIKVFSLETGKIIATLPGHEEEILCLKCVMMNGEQYLVSTSQDGYIVRWKMDSTYTKLLDRTRMADEETCMAFSVSFLPNTGNKLFLAACDDRLRLFDLEHAQIVQSFDPFYSCFCDCMKVFVPRCGLPVPLTFGGEDNNIDIEGSCDIGTDDSLLDSTRVFAYIVSRGVEMLDIEGETINSHPNKVMMHVLLFPKDKTSVFELHHLRSFSHSDYYSNSWITKLATNGRYIAAPTCNGKVFFFEIESGNVAAILNNHQGM